MPKHVAKGPALPDLHVWARPGRQKQWLDDGYGQPGWTGNCLAGRYQRNGRPGRPSARQRDVVFERKRRAGIHPVLHHEGQRAVAPAHGQSEGTDLFEGELRTDDGGRFVGQDGLLRNLGHDRFGQARTWQQLRTAPRLPSCPALPKTIPAAGPPRLTGGLRRRQPATHPASLVAGSAPRGGCRTSGFQADVDRLAVLSRKISEQRIDHGGHQRRHGCR